MDDIAGQIVQFMDTVEKLCYIKRFATLKDKKRERDSDHIMKLSFLVLMTSEYLDKNIDKQRLFELALVHDLVEADAGDVSYVDQYDNKRVVKDKKKQEMKAISAYRKLLPPPLNDRLFDLFLEYEHGKTKEAKIIRSLDKLEGDLQCLKDKNIIRYCEHAAFLARIRALKLCKYSKKTNEPVIQSLERVLLEKSEQVIAGSASNPKRYTND